MSLRIAALVCCIPFLLETPLGASAQDAPRGRSSEPILVGSRAEDSLRYLQTLGGVPLDPWSARAFGWRESARLRGDSAPPRFAWSVIPLRERSFYNSAFPYGYNDGAVWQGRGLTLALDGGVAARAGWVSIVAAPVMFWAQNGSFALMPVRVAGASRFANGAFPTSVDLPQRFGDRAYARIDPGQSTLSIEAPFASVGFTTANEWWGPMIEFPYILGDNAPGFPHVFVATPGPLDLWAVKLSARLIYGSLDESAWSPAPDSMARRFAPGFVFALQPRGVPGLEIGAERFFHVQWPSRFGWAQLRKPFEAALKANLPNTPGQTQPKENPDNQLLAAFARWVLPRSGFELYGEYGREDHSWNTRDFLLEPDHSGSLGLGFRKAWQTADSAIVGLRGELINFQPSGLIEHRGEGGTYEHPIMKQGHTQDGQLLGAPVGVGSAAGSTIELERNARDGSHFAVTWTRILRQETGRYWITNVQQPRMIDVSHALGVERGFRMRELLVTAGVQAVYELDRDYQSDAWNLHATLAAEWRP